MNETTPSTPAPESSPPPRQRRGGVLIIAAVAVIGVLFLVVFYYGILNPSSRRVGSGAAPEIEFTTYDGQQIKLSDYRGKPVVVNFWASWCVPCRDEQALLEEAWREHQGEVVFLGLDYLDQEPNALAYLKDFDVTYANGPDKGSRAYTAYHVQGVPETFFIDAEGNIQGFYVGPIPAAELEQRLQALINSSAMRSLEWLTSDTFHCFWRSSSLSTVWRPVSSPVAAVTPSSP